MSSFKTEKTERRILFLGGAYFQIPVLRYAKKEGYYIILCDYLENNPGRFFANEYYAMSTMDKDEILELAKKKNINAIVAYGSEPAMPTASYVAQELCLTGNPYKAVMTLIEKHKFRSFLKCHSFNTPDFNIFKSIEDYKKEMANLKFPLMMKPVDSSAARGVQIICNAYEGLNGFNPAMDFSRKKIVLTEDFIESKGPQLHGEVFVYNGEIIEWALGDHLYGKGGSSCVPIGTTFPSSHSLNEQKSVIGEVQRLVNLLGMKTGALNVEARIGLQGDVYLIEVGPRNGGHLVPQFASYATGFDMIGNTVRIALGFDPIRNNHVRHYFLALYAIHSYEEGVFEKVSFTKEISHAILEKHILKKEGDSIIPLTGLHAMIGAVILVFADTEVMNNCMSDIDKHIQVVLH